MSDRKTVESRTRTLSLAVALVDRVTGTRPRGAPRVTVDGDAAAARNPSGYDLFFDRSGTVTVRVDGGDRYLDAERAVDLSALDPTAPVVTVELPPSVAYRFPHGSTLVRGFVRDGDGPVPDAVVSVVDADLSTTTDANGEFVLSLDPVTAGDVVAVDDRRLVRVAGDDPRLVVAVAGVPAPVTAATVDGEAVTLDEPGDDESDTSDADTSQGRGQGRGRSGGPHDAEVAESPAGSAPIPVVEGAVTSCKLII